MEVLMVRFRKHSKTLAALGFLAPFLLVQSIFFLYSAIRALIFSFTDYNMFNTPQFVGFKNYIDLFSEPNFLHALFNTISYAAVVTTLQTFFSLVVASALNQKIKGIRFFRAAYYLPSVASSVVITLIFLWLFQRKGFLNYGIAVVRAYLPAITMFLVVFICVQVVLVLYDKFKKYPVTLLDPVFLLTSLMVALVATILATITGILQPNALIEPEFVWLQTRDRAAGIPIPLWAIIIQNIFTTIPTLVLIFLAGLQDVPKTLYEAASIDGAGVVRRFFSMTIPAIRPVMFYVVTASLIGTLQMFDQVAIFGSAAPLESIITLGFYVYNRMFPGAQLPEVGLASAAAIFLALLTMTVVMIQKLFLSDSGE